MRVVAQILLITILLATATCNNGGRQNQQNLPDEQPVSIKPEPTHQSPVNFVKTHQLSIGKEDNNLYSSSIKINVAREAPLTIQEMALKNAGIETTDHFTPTQTRIQAYMAYEQYWQLRVLFENDIFTNTDYYYTNGASIAFTTPLARTGIYKLLAGVSKNPDVECTGFSITQKIYTPTNPDVEDVLAGDRPFSGYLTIGQFRETFSLKRRLIIKSSIELGVLGPASFGGKVQSSIHQIEPIGWDNQIHNMPVINYRFLIEKGIVNQPNIELNITGSVTTGTVFNNIKTGVYFRVGQFIPLLRGEASITESNANAGDWQYWFFAKTQAAFVFYDATLQGSLFSDNDPYVIQSNQMRRIVPDAATGLALYYKRVGMEISAHYLAPEFEGALDFRYGGIRLVYSF